MQIFQQEFPSSKIPLRQIGTHSRKETGSILAASLDESMREERKRKKAFQSGCVLSIPPLNESPLAVQKNRRSCDNT